MSDIIKVVVDAMGGDNAPQAPIKGAIDAVNENDKIHVVLVGRTDDINTELAKYKYDKERVTIVFFNRCRNESCEAWRGRRICIGRKYRSHTCWWPVCCG